MPAAPLARTLSSARAAGLFIPTAPQTPPLQSPALRSWVSGPASRGQLPGQRPLAGVSPLTMALGRPGCGPCGQPHQRRRLLGLTACIGVLLLLAPWLRMFAAAGYAVAWWSLGAEVHWARPGSPAAPAPPAAAVPKLMHQTWQTKQVPEKWAAARQSCIDLHPDFEHRLWTDEEGLAFVKVRAAVAGGSLRKAEVPLGVPTERGSRPAPARVLVVLAGRRRAAASNAAGGAG